MIEAMWNMQTLVWALKQSNLPINPDRIYVAGHSAGAVTTYAVALRSNKDGSPMEEATRQETNPLIPSTNALSTIVGGFVIGGASCGYSGWSDGILGEGRFKFKTCPWNVNPMGDACIVMILGIRIRIR
jgi:alpha/beta hydrolase fold